MQAVLQRIKEYGLRLRKEKCSFLQESVEYIGHVISRQGIHPSPKKIGAIQKIAEPTNIIELKSFLGIVVYFAKFLPQLSERAAPLNELLKKGIPWNWASEKSAAFNRLKDDFMSMSVSMHFDPNLPLGLACDASGSGIGAILSKWRGTSYSLCLKVVNPCGEELLANRERRFELSAWREEISSVFMGTYLPVGDGSQTTCNYI